MTDFRIDTPDPRALKVLATKLQLDVLICQSNRARLAATITGPKGPLALLSA